MELIEEVKNRLINNLESAKVEIIDQSQQHAGHGDPNKGSHFNAIIVSDEYEGLNLIQRHKKIYQILGEDMGTRIHAFSMKTYTHIELNQK